LAKKLAHQSQSSTVLALPEAEQKKVAAAGTGNWFGENLKAEGAANGSSSGGGVGRYLKRTRETLPDAVPADEPSKKRKTGWGDFTGW
jgi:peptidyl-prolyl cis-trans isomerase-like protein 2